MSYQDQEQQRAYNKAYRERNKERTQAYNAEYYAKNKNYFIEYYHAHKDDTREARSESSKQWLAAHPEHQEKNRARAREWTRMHGERNRLRCTLWRQAHLEREREMNRAWRQAHPEKVREQWKIKRARKAQAPMNDFTAKQWTDIKELWDHCCAYCKKHQERLTQDHIIPLSKGGSHTMLNIVPACRSCNASKGTKDLAVFAPTFPFCVAA